MFITSNSEWGYIACNMQSTRPNNPYGTLVPYTTQNVYGTYTQILSAVTADIWAITILVNNIGSSATATDAMMTIGLDPLGGTSFTDFGSDLLISSASPFSLGPGVIYEFPVGFAAGCSVGAKVKLNAVKSSNASVIITVYGLPKFPERHNKGSYIISMGTSGATSTGTAITPGTTSDGTWLNMGSPSAPCWFWEYGFGTNQATMMNNTYAFDIGIGDGSGNQRQIVNNALVLTTNAESAVKLPSRMAGGYGYCGTSDVMYIRTQCGANAAAGNESVALYGVGG